MGVDAGSRRSMGEAVQIMRECPTEIEVTAINARRSADGHPFSEVLITVDYVDGDQDFFCSRLWYPLTDTPHQRASEREAFIRRQRKVPGV